eukprot:gene34933-45212_t
MDIPRECLNTKPLSLKFSSEFHDSSRILPTSSRKSAAEPEHVPVPMTASATISVSGQSFSIPSPDSCIFASSIAIASNYLGIFRLTSVEFPSIQQLEELFESVRSFFAPEAFEKAALESANQFAWSDEILNRDRDLLLSLGSLDAVLTFHMDHHRTVGMNSSRVREWLFADPRLDLLIELADYGGVVDVDDDFIPFRHSGPLRPLQQRLLPVYRKHAHKLWSSGKGLLLRVSDIPPHILSSMHTGNSCHLVPKPDTPEGRFIIDASNVSEGRIPLNGLSAKEKAIARYGQWQLQWSDMIIFKEDIKGCFNQLRWSIPSAKLLGSMVDDDVVFVMVTGGFGHTSTPMQWDVFGQAIRRRVKHGSSPELTPSAPLCDQGPLLCPLDIYVDDSFGAGRPDHVQIARERVVLVTEGIISDASPWRLAAGLYDYGSGRLLCWSTLLLPFAPTDAHRFQTQREYLGHLFSLLLMLSHCKCNQLTQIVSYQWVNDNTGAIEWVNTHKCSSQSSLFVCMAVSQLNLLTNIWAADAVHIPGETMGEIDAMSRIERQGDPFIACPSLTSDLFIPLEDPDIIELFRLCDPSVTQSSPVEHHSNFCTRSFCIGTAVHSTPALSELSVTRLGSIRKYLGRAQQSVQHSVLESSRKTYGTGIRRWLEFVKIFGTDPLMQVVPPEFMFQQSDLDVAIRTSWQEACIMGYLEWLQCPPHKIAPKTAFGYLCAVRYYLIGFGVDLKSMSQLSIAKQKKGLLNDFLMDEANSEANTRTIPLSVDIIQGERPTSYLSCQDLAFYTAMSLGFTILSR